MKKLLIVLFVFCIGLAQDVAGLEVYADGKLVTEAVDTDTTDLVLTNETRDLDFSGSSSIKMGDTDFQTNSISGIKFISQIQYYTNTYVGTTINWNWTNGNSQSVVITNNATLANPGGQQPCDMTLFVIQDGVGGHTLAFGSDYEMPNDVGITIESGANRVSPLFFKHFDADNILTKDGDWWSP